MTSRAHRTLGVVAVLALVALVSCSDESGSTTAGGAEAAAPESTVGPETTAGVETTEAGLMKAESSTPETIESQSATGAALSGEQYTPVTMETLSEPTWMTNSEGIVQLSYELRLTNAFPFPATVTEVVVTEVASGEAVQTLSGDDLLAARTLQPSGAVPDVELEPAEVGIVWIDIPFDDPAQLPAEVENTVSISLPDDLPIELPDPITWTAARVAVDAKAPVVIGPPLEGPGWVALGSCCDGPHRRAMNPINNEVWLAQRYAIDFNKLSADDQFATGDPDVNESWPTYDQPVLAVEDATVVQDTDESPTRSPTTWNGAARGGRRQLRHPGDLRGRVRLRRPPRAGLGRRPTRRHRHQGPGHRPHRELRQLDRSHLHFQVVERPSALVASSVAYVFDTFAVTGQTPPIADVIAADPQQPTAIDTATAGPRTDQLPIGRDVLEFAPVE